MTRALKEKTPRMWGWTGRQRHEPGSLRENPTYVGMDRMASTSSASTPTENPTYVGMDPCAHCGGHAKLRKPHVCGDGPQLMAKIDDAMTKTPRMWGWTAFITIAVASCLENPTYVGMDRGHPSMIGAMLPKTPRMWGWTGHTDGLQRRRRENPTYVGMDR